MITAISEDQNTVIIYDPIKNITWDNTESIKSYGWYQRLRGPN